ncbi:QacR transcriptional regulator [Staphylococcus aureus]|nr:QacR transcriptional regulator [Staphylococcus aureus]
MKDKILGVAKELFIKNGYNATTTGEIVKLSEVVKGIFIITLKQRNLFLEILNIEESKWQEQWKKEQIKCKTNREKFYLYNELSLTTEYYYPLQNAIIEFYTEYYKLIALMKK